MNRELALLKLQAAPGVGARTLYDLLTRLVHESVDAASFVQLPFATLVSEYHLGESAAEYLLADDDMVAKIADEFSAREIEIVALCDESYPAKLQSSLGKTAPPLLFAWGNLSLLRQPMIAICGAREASETGLIAARELAVQLARDQIVVVSGNAKGIDSAAHHGALTGGGATVIVTPLGILNFGFRAESGAHADPHNTLVLSEFPPRVGWHSRNAMIRNRTIAALCNAMIVIEPGPAGGTLEAGKAALKLRKPLFVTELPSRMDTPSGAHRLLADGACSLPVEPHELLDLEPVYRAI